MDINIIEGRDIATLQDTLGHNYGTDIFDVPNGSLLHSLRLVIDSAAAVLMGRQRVIVQALGGWEDIGTSGRGTLEIQSAPSGCTVVTLDPQFITAGDTASILIQSEDGNGVLSSYPPSQLFDIVIKSGSEDGTLLSLATGATNSFFRATPGPFAFIASTDTSPDTVTVEIEAYPSAFSPKIAGSKQTKSAIQSKISATVSRQATLDAIGKNFAIAQTTSLGPACGLNPPMATEFVGPKKPLSNMDLSIDPKEITHSSFAILKVDLYSGGHLNANYLEPGSTTALINVFAGDGGLGYAHLMNGTSSGYSLLGIPYRMIGATGIQYIADGNEYMGRFPLRIDIAVSTQSANGLLTAGDLITLTGPNSVGKYFSQNDTTWADSSYDSEIDTAATRKNGDTTYCTIGDKGCMLSCLAMALTGFGYDFDPLKLNDSATNRKDFDINGSGNLHPRAVISQFTHKGVQTSMYAGIGLDCKKGAIKFPKSTPSLAALDLNLDEGYPAIAQIINPKTGHPHFILVTGKTSTGKYTISDPDNPDFVVLDPNSTTIYKYMEVFQ